MWTTGLLIWGIYETLQHYKLIDWHFNFWKNKDNFAIIAGTFAFTMMGFLVTSMTILFSIGGQRRFVNYRESGRLESFMLVYKSSVVSMFLIFLFALLLLAEGIAKEVIDALGILLINSFVQLIFLNIVVYNLIKVNVVNKD
jgi:hypothetical protein